jgi:hypothetical protein
VTDRYGELFYRPLPIFWFAGAMILQAVMLTILFVVAVVMLRAQPLLIVAAGAVWSILMLYRIWPKKMRDAALSWRLATVFFVSIQFGLFAFGCLTVMPCKEVYAWPSESCLREGQDSETTSQAIERRVLGLGEYHAGSI